jgi:hypothetical protein
MTEDDSMQEKLALANARASGLISLAEDMFGPMTSPWTYAGVTFRDHPPHLYYAPDQGSVQIALSLRALEDNLQMDFQLSHEVCHLLYPSVEPNNPAKPRTSVLNEGISTYFSVLVVVADHGEAAGAAVLHSLAENSKNYHDAYKQVAALLRIDRHAIRKIRKIQPMINKVCRADFQAASIPLNDAQIELLTSIC